MEILIAEDNSAVRLLYETTLKQTGHTLVLTKNGTEAFARFTETTPGMVITDWDMPGMNGIDLCRKIRSYENDRYTYIIFVTSMDRKEDAVQGLDAGADDYIRKPFHGRELMARIRAGERILQLEERISLATAELYRSEKMAAVGRLAAGIAHEVNNPLGAISGNLEVLESYHLEFQQFIDVWKGFYLSLNQKKNLDLSIMKGADAVRTSEEEKDLTFLMEDSREILTESRDSVRRIAALVDDLRTFARPGEADAKKVDVNGEIETALRIVKNEMVFAEPVGLDFGTLPLLECQAAQLNQVFYALLANAAHATREKGRVRIATKEEGGTIVVTVSDTGTGIEKEELPRLFDPFFTTRKAGEGRGMGLHLAYHIVKSHGGSIEVKSDYGKGTVFTLVLPLSFSRVEANGEENGEE
ncbi:MAG: response regulator [Desulfobacteraceae bacterium]